MLGEPVTRSCSEASFETFALRSDSMRAGGLPPGLPNGGDRYPHWGGAKTYWVLALQSYPYRCDLHC